MERVIGGFFTRRDAHETISLIMKMIRDYGEVTMSDVKEFVGLTPLWEDRSIHWDERTFKNIAIDPDGDLYYAINLLTDEEALERIGHINTFCIFI